MLFTTTFNHHKNNILPLANSQSHKTVSGKDPCFDYIKKQVFA